jgi:uncharacterized protein YdhG (YjbR/CyaY superfamily)
MAITGAKQAAPATVDEYLAPLSEANRAALEELRKFIKAEVPEVKEAIGYGIPGYKYKGKHLVSLGAWKDHLAVYGLNIELARELQGNAKLLDISGKTIQFTADNPLPPDLVRTLLKSRVDEIDSEKK